MAGKNLLALSDLYGDGEGEEVGAKESEDSLKRAASANFFWKLLRFWKLFFYIEFSVASCSPVS